MATTSVLTSAAGYATAGESRQGTLPQRINVLEKGTSDVPRAGRSPVGMQDKFTQSEDEFGVAHISGVVNRRLQIPLSELLQKNHELLSKWLASTARTKPVASLAFNLNK
jgi:hypothetical protein